MSLLADRSTAPVAYRARHIGRLLPMMIGALALLAAAIAIALSAPPSQESGPVISDAERQAIHDMRIGRLGHR